MGLASTSSHAIWFVALVGAASIVLSTAFYVAEVVPDASESAADVAAARMSTRVSDAVFCYRTSTQTVRVEAVNAGATTLAPSKVAFLIDGVAALPYNQSVDGAASDIWSTDERAFFNITGIATTPTRVTLATENGLMVYATSQPCPTMVHIDAITTYKNNVSTSSFIKRDTVETRVTVKDDAGLVVSGVSVTIEIRDPSTTLMHTGSATTNATGIASISYMTPSNAPTGTWTDAVTAASGASVTYDSAANVVTQVTFTVSNN